MFGSVFLWIYRLDFHEVLFLLAVFTALFCLLKEKFGRYTWWNFAIAALLLAWVVAIVSQTVLGRAPDTSLEPILRPFQSYTDALKEGGQPELLRSNFMNAVLFYPAGLLLASLLPRKWNMLGKAALLLLAFAALSTAIEAAQYHFSLGLAQTDDVIHNTLGAAAGTAIMLWLQKYIH